MATKQQVIALHRQHPDWSSQRIADEIDCEASYVRATFYRNGLKFSRAQPKREIVLLGEACVAAGLSLSDITKLKGAIHG